MSEPERIHTSKLPDTFQEVEGFGKPERNVSRTSRPDPGAPRRPVDPVPAARTPKPDDGAQKPSTRSTTTKPLTRLERALARAAERQARQLKRGHRALYATDPRHFRKIVRLAQAQIFRQKPGPKPDRQAARRIAHAARQRARGAKWTDLYPKYIPGYKELNPVTRSDAEDGFRRKVNKYRQSHRRLRDAE